MNNRDETQDRSPASLSQRLGSVFLMHDQLGVEQLQGLIKYARPSIIGKMLDSFNYVSSGFTFRAGVCLLLFIPIVFHARIPHEPYIEHGQG